MIFPIYIQDRQQLPQDIVRHIKSFLNRDEIFNYTAQYSRDLIQKLKKPRWSPYYEAYGMPSYYDNIRKSQLSSKQGFQMKWKRYEIHKNPNVPCYKTKPITYNYENGLQYFFSIYDTACTMLSNQSLKPYTERTCCLKISLTDSFNFYLDTLEYVTSLLMQQDNWKDKIRIEHSDGYIWIWWRQDIYFEFFEDYVSRYSEMRRVCLFKQMDNLCFLIHHYLRLYFESPFFQYMFSE